MKLQLAKIMHSVHNNNISNLNFGFSKVEKFHYCTKTSTKSNFVQTSARTEIFHFTRFLSFYSLHYAEACNEFVGPISASLRPSNTLHFEKMSQWWRAVGNTLSDLTGPRFEPQISRTREERVIPLDHLDVAKVYFCLALN